MTAKTLVVTNDFPPRQGGIQSYVHELARRQPAGSIVVYASDHEGSARFDAEQPFPVIRHPTGLLVPTPAARRRTVAALREHGATTVWFGASAPLGLLAPALRRAGAQRVVASTHGHEAGWAMLPGRPPDAARDRAQLRRRHLHHAVHPRPDGERARRPPGAAAARTWSRRRDLPTRTSTARRPRAARPDRPAGDRVRVAPGQAQGPGPAHRGAAGRAASRPGRSAAAGRIRPVRAAPARPGARARRGRARRVRRRSAVPRSCPSTTRPATCSRCRAARGAAASTSRASAWSTSRRRRPGCRWWPATPVARRRRCARARPATWSAGAIVDALIARLVALLDDAALRARLGHRRSRLGRARVDVGRCARPNCATCSPADSG